MTHPNYTKQEKHLVAVDCVIFGYENAKLKLLLFKRHLEPDQGKWSLVGGWLNNNESVDVAAKRVLSDITGLDDIFMDQIQVFSKPERDPGGRVLSVVFYALIDIVKHDKDRISKYGADWCWVENLPPLIFDHHEMFQLALGKLREKANYNLVGRDLLPKEFTITQLRQLYNSIYAKEFDPGNFRKKILSLNILDRMDKKDTSESKKGAFYYKFKKAEDIDLTRQIIGKQNI